MSRVPSLSSPFLIGFDQIERALDRVAKAADGYPPYNIERLAADGNDPERLRITLAVAGFTLDQLEVTVEEKELVIRGRQQDDKTRQYLHRGIAARQFQRTFVLADGMEVQKADLKNGLLSIDLARPSWRRRPRSTGRGEPQNFLTFVAGLNRGWFMRLLLSICSYHVIPRIVPQPR